jgi:hypothetical protein
MNHCILYPPTPVPLLYSTYPLILVLYSIILLLSSKETAIMSKLSPALKQLINAPFARPGALPAPQGIKTFYQNLAKDAKDRGVGVPAWLSMAVCL